MSDPPILVSKKKMDKICTKNNKFLGEVAAIV